MLCTEITKKTTMYFWGFLGFFVIHCYLYCGNIKNPLNNFQQNNDTQNSTPYNRVDHCFIRKSINNKNNKIIKNNKLLKCNYSDHLPMFQKLEPITHL